MTARDPAIALAAAYDRAVSARTQAPVAAWKIEERQHFLVQLRGRGGRRLLEIGAGPGRDALYFARMGLDVTATDLSAGMVRRCRALGIDARQVDVRQLDFPPASVDGVFALNSLLHLPRRDLPDVLTRLHVALAPDGLLYLALYGGPSFEGVRSEDTYRPRRFFASYTDVELRLRLSPKFEPLTFRRIPVEGHDSFHIQSLIVRRRQAAGWRRRRGSLGRKAAGA